MTDTGIRERPRARTRTEVALLPEPGARRIVLFASLVASVIVLLALAGCGRGSEPPPDDTADLFEPAETEPIETEIPQEKAGAEPMPEPTPSPPTDLHVNVGEELAEGNEGPDVEQLQRALQALGIDPGPIDGIFGPKTKAAVTSFQEQNDLKADGVANEETLMSINEALGQEVGG